jgi:hypothetical protein
MTTYEDMDASYLLWELIWKKDSNTFTELNMLDSVLIDNGAMRGWLFTSSNGTVYTYTQIHLYTYTPIHLYTYTPLHPYTYNL